MSALGQRGAPTERHGQPTLETSHLIRGAQHSRRGTFCSYKLSEHFNVLCYHNRYITRGKIRTLGTDLLSTPDFVRNFFIHF